MSKKRKNASPLLPQAAPSPSMTRVKLRQAMTLHRQGALTHARILYEDILRGAPGHYDALHMLGVIASQCSQHQRAVELIGEAIAIYPDDPVAHANRSVSLQALGEHESAIAHCDRALTLKPDYVDALYNRASSQYEINQLNEAIAGLNRVIELQPHHEKAHWTRSLALLASGNFEDGWQAHEWRHQVPMHRPYYRHFSQPAWRGEPLSGKTILLHSEQGLGDTLQFCRYAPLVAQRGARVLLEVDAPLVSLLEDLQGVDVVAAKGLLTEPFDYQCLLLSLPFAFQTRLDTIPSPRAYLHAPPEKVTQWSERLGPRKLPRVGLVWSGSVGHHNDRARSLALSELLPYLPEGLEFICLQIELRERDREALGAAPHIRCFHDAISDFSDTAALCDLMDVVVSVDTSVAHLGGALGKTTWVMLPHFADWRWMLDRPDSPWYPTMTLYRQTARGQWHEPLQALKRDLIHLAQQNKDRPPMIDKTEPPE